MIFKIFPAATIIDDLAVSPSLAQTAPKKLFIMIVMTKHKHGARYANIMSVYSEMPAMTQIGSTNGIVTNGIMMERSKIKSRPCSAYFSVFSI